MVQQRTKRRSIFLKKCSGFHSAYLKVKMILDVQSFCAKFVDGRFISAKSVPLFYSCKPPPSIEPEIPFISDKPDFPGVLGGTQNFDRPLIWQEKTQSL